jgi:hypothetical protein
LQAQPQSILTLVFERPVPTAVFRGGRGGRPEALPAGIRGASQGARGIRYSAAAGEPVRIEASTFKGRMLFRTLRTHSANGPQDFAWRGEDGQPWVARVSYPETGQAYRILLLP